MAIEIPRSLVEYILLGPMEDRRQLQDSPILGDVWIAFARSPDQPQDLLITPFEAQPASLVAQSISRRLSRIPKIRANKQHLHNVAYLQDIAAARLQFSELMRVVVPLTKWWEDKQRQELERTRATDPQRQGTDFFLDIKAEQFERWIKDVLTLPSASPSSTGRRTDRHSEIKQTWIDPFQRYLALTGLILWAAQPEKEPSPAEAPQEILGSTSLANVPEGARRSKRRARKQEINLADAGSPEKMLRQIDPVQIADLVYKLFQNIKADENYIRNIPDDKLLPGERGALTPQNAPVWQISLNRRAMPALERSLPAVKADAATSLFKVDCKDIAWAILDSGIHGSHPAFEDANGRTRIRASYDFRNIRKIISLENTDGSRLNQCLAELCPNLQDKAEKASKRDALRRLAKDATDQRPIHWELVEQFIRIDHNKEPSSGHGTHVAGIVGARRTDPTTNIEGLCPTIRLYDFRILSRSAEDTEFAIIAALQYIRHLNSRSSFMRIHGANLSLSIPHDVRNYACGRTPVCVECERLVDSGVVVVAAAGNHGWHSYETNEGIYEGYAAFSITDPGNADGVITVGATHRSWPHTYGVSFFSSRGPTGDGRLKPDLVAPGERIRSTLPNGNWGELDGTSMAAPHVSGAAAMLMARYPELVGRPRRIKQILCDSATDLGRERSFQGHGMLDVLRAFQSV
jgi:hypothetical protein